LSADPSRINAITGSLPCCAWPASGHVAAQAAARLMKSRRRMVRPSGKTSYHTGTLIGLEPVSLLQHRPPYSITSSAVNRNLDGISRLSALAALRLIASSSLVG